MKIPRTKRAWARLKWVTERVLSRHGRDIVPEDMVEPGGRRLQAKDDFWQGHAIVNVGREWLREVVGIEDNRKAKAIYFLGWGLIIWGLYLWLS